MARGQDDLASTGACIDIEPPGAAASPKAVAEVIEVIDTIGKIAESKVHPGSEKFVTTTQARAIIRLDWLLLPMVQNWTPYSQQISLQD